ncbi:protein translocase subunit SecD [Candidatus Parcubacteria bacterium]|nr:MAG: protein translocase subunit SecD [Candidatus Parcubacteria bacterium]
MLKTRLIAGFVLLVGALLGWQVYSWQENGTRPFRLGLDLSGGTQLVYRADTSAIAGSEIAESMEALRDTIERRVNLFGVSEPIVQTQKGGTFAGDSEERLLIELPGVTDTEEAIRLIGQTPVLEFRMLKGDVPPGDIASSTVNDLFEAAAVTGKHLSRAEIQFNQAVGGIPNQPVVVLHFDSEGAKIFAELTRDNVGRYFGIFLDGTAISVPIIQEAIPNGTAVISGNFSAEGARELARNLNYGALPVPIELLSTQTVSGTLGAEAVDRGISAAVWGIVAVAAFMILWYRLPGVIAVIALSLYIIITLALFQWIPVTLTAAGIAAFILSVGMAVDANVLIFERMKEELLTGKNTKDAIREGFSRAWLSIRDSNISSMITATILFWFGTSLIKGFALVFGLGVLVSMLTAITVSRTLMFALDLNAEKGIMKFLFGSGTAK